MAPRQEPPPIPEGLDEAAVPPQSTRTVGPAVPPLLGGVPEDYDPTTGEPQNVYAVVRRDQSRAGLAETGGLNRYYRETVTPAQFREGDQLALYNMTPAELAALQDQMIRAGLLDPESLPSGRRGFVGPADTDPTFAAYEQLLAFANQAGHASPTAALQALQSGRYGQGPGGITGRPSRGRGGSLPGQLSNPDDLRRVFRAAVIDELGTGWDEQRIDALVQTYRGMERAQMAQQEQLALQSADTGQTPAPVDALPDPSTFALAEARKADPTSAQAQDFLGAAGSFLQLIGSWQPQGELPQ